MSDKIVIRRRRRLRRTRLTPAYLRTLPMDQLAQVLEVTPGEIRRALQVLNGILSSDLPFVEKFEMLEQLTELHGVSDVGEKLLQKIMELGACNHVGQLIGIRGIEKKDFSV